MAKTAKSKEDQEQSDTDTAFSPSEAQGAARGLESEAKPTIKQIEERAYQIYLERGGADGNQLDDWLQAERELGGTSE